MSLNWNREALDNGDGPATVVAYNDEGNELFWCKETETTPNQWVAFVYRHHWAFGSEKINGVFEDRESAEKICEHFHELAEIDHGYN